MLKAGVVKGRYRLDEKKLQARRFQWTTQHLLRRGRAQHYGMPKSFIRSRRITLSEQWARGRGDAEPQSCRLDWSCAGRLVLVVIYDLLGSLDTESGATPQRSGCDGSMKPNTAGNKSVQQYDRCGKCRVDKSHSLDVRTHTRAHTELAYKNLLLRILKLSSLTFHQSDTGTQTGRKRGNEKIVEKSKFPTCSHQPHVATCHFHHLPVLQQTLIFDLGGASCPIMWLWTF